MTAPATTDADRDAMDPVFSFEDDGARHDPGPRADQRMHEFHRRACGAERRAALRRDDPRAHVAEPSSDFFLVLRRQCRAPPADLGAAEHGHDSLAVLAQDGCGDLDGRDVQAVGEDRPEPLRIQEGAGAQHAGPRPSGRLPSDCRHDVHRVRQHDEARAPCHAGDVSAQVRHESGVRMQEVEPGHLRLSPLSRRQDDDVAIREIVDLAHADRRLGGHAQSMADVLRLSPREVGYRIDEDEFVPRAFSREGERDRATDLSDSDDPGLHDLAIQGAGSP